MIYIEDQNKYNRILEFTINFKKKQFDLETEDTFVYPAINVGDAIRYKVLYEEFLFHPLVLRTRKFYEEPQTLSTKKEIIAKISEVLTFEFTNEDKDVAMSEKVVRKIIASHKRLTKTKTKNENSSGA